MKDTEIRKYARDYVMASLKTLATELGGVVGKDEIIIPVCVDGQLIYQKIKTSTCQWKDTKAHKAFDIQNYIIHIND